MTLRVKKIYRFFLLFLKKKTDDFSFSFLYSKNYFNLFISFEEMMGSIRLEIRMLTSAYLKMKKDRL